MSKQEALDYNILRTKVLEKKISEQDKQLQEFLETIKELKKLVGLFEHRKVYTNDDLEKLIKLINNL